VNFNVVSLKRGDGYTSCFNLLLLPAHAWTEESGPCPHPADFFIFKNSCGRTIPRVLSSKDYKEKIFHPRMG
jgi:hypothetical protein